MGDVKIKQIPALNIEQIAPLQIQEFTGLEPLRIGQIAPAAVHIKELNHIDPISVESLRIDEIRNLDPVRVERFDVTHLPTVNVSMSRLPSVDLNVRRVPPVAVGLHQDFFLPSQYTVHAKLLGVEFLRLNIHGRTMVTPRDHARREVSRMHERSFPDVAAVGNPAIPTRQLERSVVATMQPAVCHEAPRGRPVMAHAARPGSAHVGAATRMAPAAARPFAPPSDLSVGMPRFSYPISEPRGDHGESAVSWGGEG